MIRCLEACKKLKTVCPVEDCRYWIKFEEDMNCTFESINKNDAMTLREVAERIGVSYVRVKQIEDKILAKIKNMF
tara:strand:- start:366 stop:590 length:225 start_codon:yes stop_codon:yes gene_type:complete